jgi:3-hydroxyacyl-CoA dehydrogenase
MMPVVIDAVADQQGEAVGIAVQADRRPWPHGPDAAAGPELLLGEAGANFRTAGTTVSEDANLRTWTLDGEVLIASIKTKMHTLSPEVCEGLMAAVDLAEREYQGLVIWSGDEPFSAGADLQALLPAFMAVGVAAVEDAEGFMQQMMLRLRYANVPVVSAMRGLALGGGCELAVHSARRVAHMESYVGLVEVGVGLIPGAGGLTYIASRAAENAKASTGKDLLPFLTEGFTAAAMAKVGTSAIESRSLGYLLESDAIVPHKDELLCVATNEAKAMFASGYRAPHKRLFAIGPPTRSVFWEVVAVPEIRAQADELAERLVG